MNLLKYEVGTFDGCSKQHCVHIFYADMGVLGGIQSVKIICEHLGFYNLTPMSKISLFHSS